MNVARRFDAWKGMIFQCVRPEDARNSRPVWFARPPDAGQERPSQALKRLATIVRPPGEIIHRIAGRFWIMCD